MSSCNQYMSLLVVLIILFDMMILWLILLLKDICGGFALFRLTVCTNLKANNLHCNPKFVNLNQT